MKVVKSRRPREGIDGVQAAFVQAAFFVRLLLPPFRRGVVVAWSAVVARPGDTLRTAHENYHNLIRYSDTLNERNPSLNPATQGSSTGAMASAPCCGGLRRLSYEKKSSSSSSSPKLTWGAGLTEAAARYRRTESSTCAVGPRGGGRGERRVWR